MAHQFPDAKLEIIGAGELRERAESLSRRLGIEDSVTFHGAVDHGFVLSRLQAAAVLLQHCISLPGEGVESLGLSLLEAMACGVPVVSTRHGAIPQTVQHGVTGLLVEERDVEGMAAGIAGSAGGSGPGGGDGPGRAPAGSRALYGGALQRPAARRHGPAAARRRQRRGRGGPRGRSRPAGREPLTDTARSAQAFDRTADAPGLPGPPRNSFGENRFPLILESI